MPKGQITVIAETDACNELQQCTANVPLAKTSANSIDFYLSLAYFSKSEFSNFIFLSSSSTSAKK